MSFINFVMGSTSHVTGRIRACISIYFNLANSEKTSDRDSGFLHNWDTVSSVEENPKLLIALPKSANKKNTYRIII